MMIDKAEIKEMAARLGAPMTGIAPIHRFTCDGDKFGLLSLKPDTKSVIVMGFPINRGALRGVEEGTNWGAVNTGSPNQPMIIPAVTYKFCKAFEQTYGCEATCLTKISLPTIKQDSDAPAANTVMFFEYAAYAAGLGEIAMGKFFLTKDFGTRQYFAVILTDAEIEPDEIFKKNICDGCMECVNACPNQAINIQKIATEKVAGQDIKWYELCLERCFICQTGALSNQYLDDGDFNILNRGAKAMTAGVEPTRITAACGRACAAHLEKTIMKHKFVNPFRSR